jgi:hypothetical protein
MLVVMPMTNDTDTTGSDSINDADWDDVLEASYYDGGNGDPVASDDDESHNDKDHRKAANGDDDDNGVDDADTN